MTAAAKPTIAGRQGRLFHGFDQPALAFSAFTVLLSHLDKFPDNVSARLAVHRRQPLARLHQACWQRLALL